MILNSIDITLYHASYTIVESVDLAMCKKRNDFGNGFYMTTDNEQAERFVKTSILKSGRDLKFGYVNIYRMIDYKGLTNYEFEATNKEWLHCVCAFRRAELLPNETDKWASYDVMIGKIANDNTMLTLAIYLASGYGEVGSESAIDTAIKALKPEKLKDQVCLKTGLALSKLVFKDAYEVVAK